MRAAAAVDGDGGGAAVLLLLIEGVEEEEEEEAVMRDEHLSALLVDFDMLKRVGEATTLLKSGC